MQIVNPWSIQEATPSNECMNPKNDPVPHVRFERRLPSFATEKQKEEMTKTIQPMFLKFHDEWIATIANSQHIVTKDSGHGIPFEEPELVINSIRQVVEQSMHHP
jgi:hypothetical protein